MIWGVTGTRQGGTPYQIASIGWLFSRYGITELHNGDCIGVDSQVYYLARAFVAHITLHPPINHEYRALNGDHKDKWWPEKEYHERNRDIVLESEALVACPKRSIPAELEESEPGGTWNTIRCARRFKKPIAIVWPNGHITYENWKLTYDQLRIRWQGRKLQ